MWNLFFQDEKESDEKKDTKSVTSEKKDPEKGEKEDIGDGNIFFFFYY